MNVKSCMFYVLMLLMLSSTVFGVELIDLAYANFIPEGPPPGFVIESDGTVGATNIRRDGNIYTFTGDIHNSIIVLRDDIVLDGAGYTLQGNGNSTGIFLQDKNNVTIKNMRVKNFMYGIKFTRGYGASAMKTGVSSTISGNTITNNTYGVYWFSPNYVISENLIANNTYGAVFYGEGHMFRNNKFENNKYSISDKTSGISDIDTSNTVDGKPVYYWVNQQDRAVPVDAGYVALKNCNNITVKDLSLKSNGEGILVCNTNNSTIRENVITSNFEGIALKFSSNNVISNNQITFNNASGISLLYNSTNNVISGNSIASNGYGIGIDYGSNNNAILENEVTLNVNDGVTSNADSVSTRIAENQITANGGNGIFLSNIKSSNIIGNNITLNKRCGIGFGDGPNGVVKGNYVSKNNVGIWVSNAAANTITLNTITENEGWGIRLEGSHQNNTIHHNNFIDNNNKGVQASITEVWTYPDLFARLAPGQTPRPPQLVPGAANAWDNGSEGNYWSDYTNRYPNASTVDGSRVGNTPYFINDNNFDNYPLMEALDIYEMHSPPPEYTSPSTTSALNLTHVPSTSPMNPAPEGYFNQEPSGSIIILAAGTTIACIILLLYLKRNRKPKSPK